MYYRPDPGPLGGPPLRPPGRRRCGDHGPARSSGPRPRCAAAGIAVTAWAVVTHNSRLAGAGECAVRNAFGDVYPWALCAGSAAVRGYAAALAAEVAALAGVDAIELEACGWYGFEHGSAHDKTGDGPGRAGARWTVAALAVLLRGVRAGVPVSRGVTRPSWPPRSARPPTAARRCPATRRGARRGPGRPPPGGCSPRCSPRSARPPPASPSWCTPRPIRAPSGANPGYDPAVLCGPGGADGIVLACGNPATAAGPGRPHRGGRAARRPDRRRPAGRRRPGRPAGDPAPRRPRRSAPPAPPSCASTTPAWPRRPTWPPSRPSARPSPATAGLPDIGLGGLWPRPAPGPGNTTGPLAAGPRLPRPPRSPCTRRSGNCRRDVSPRLATGRAAGPR